MSFQEPVQLPRYKEKYFTTACSIYCAKETIEKSTGDNAGSMQEPVVKKKSKSTDNDYDYINFFVNESNGPEGEAQSSDTGKVNSTLGKN